MALTAAGVQRPRGAADAPGQTAQESLNAASGGFPIATANLYKAGWPLVSEIVGHWQRWPEGMPRN